MINQIEIRHFHFFCGLGGGAKGFNKGRARVGNLTAGFRCIGGIDNDPAAIEDFGKLAGVPGTLMDLFTREQYEAFHGRRAPDDFHVILPADIHRAAGFERPHIIFFSAPCKGFSGLLAEKVSKTAKYQALNELTLRGVWLALESWKDDPPELIVFENVPRIMKRGRHLLDQIIALLRAYGYAVAETTHDCGEIGGLAQSRKRFLLVARHEQKVPPFLYEPPKRALRGVGEVIGKFPVPGPDLILPMHRMPSLQWQTWLRLAFVEAGADWRSLNKLNVKDGFLADYGIEPVHGFRSTLGVTPWEEAANTVKGRSGPTNGTCSVADPREVHGHDFHGLRVNEWEGRAAAITTQRSPGSSAQSVADPRPGYGGSTHHNVLNVHRMEDTAKTITSGRHPAGGALSVADPRLENGHPKSVQLGVRRWHDTGATVKGDMSVGTGPYGVSDPRIAGGPRFNNVYRIVPFDAVSPAVAGGGGPAGGLAVADPRSAHEYQQTKYRVTEFNGPAGTVIAASTTGNGAFGVADPRYENWHPGASSQKMRVTGWEQKSGVVTGAQQVGSGALSVSDPRPRGLNERRESYVTGGHYGVTGWEEASGAVPASSKNNNGKWSVADPRNGYGEISVELPEPKTKLVCYIRALDGTWHRPFTTLELGALQSLVCPEEIVELHGLSDSAWRERIGNAVPPDAAEAIASVMGHTLLLAWSGHTFGLGSTPIWVRDIAVALSVQQPVTP